MDSTRRDLCSASAWQATFASVLYHLRDALTTTDNSSETNCQKVQKKFTTEAIFMICLILIFLTLSFIGTFVGVWEIFNDSSRKKIPSSFTRRKSRNTTTKTESEEKSTEYTVFFRRFRTFLDCFCIQKNTKSILDTTAKNQFDAINGMRTIALFWVILAHIGIYYVNVVRYPNDDFENMLKSPIVKLIIDGKLPIEILFVISGFLNALSFCKDYKKKSEKAPFFSFYIRRFVRCFPTQMIVLGFYAALMPYTGSGRLWPNYDTNPVCKTTWGWNLLHLNNFQNQYRQCFKPSWFYACVMQLHIISPLFLVPLIKWPIVGYACICVCILGSCLVRFALIVKFNLIDGFSAITFDFSDFKTFYDRFHLYLDTTWDKPYTRLSSFLVGIVYGFHFHRKNFTKAGMSNRFSLYFGLMAMVISTWVSSIRSDVEYSAWGMAVHSIVSSFVLCVCTSWIVCVCSSGQGGWLNDFLAHKYFAPVSRLSFSCHQINMILIERYFLLLEQPIEYSAVSLALLTLHLFFWTFVASFIVAVVFEIPVSKLVDLVSKKLKE